MLKPYWSHVVCIYVTAEASGAADDNALVERQIRDCEALLKSMGLPRRPFLCYIDAPLTSANYRPIKGADWQAVRLYLGPESPSTTADALGQLHALWTAQKALVKVPIVIVAQAYDRNGAWKNIDVLLDMQSQFGILISDPQVVGALFFAYSRPGGVTTYPALKQWHREIFKANPGRPNVITIPWPQPVPVPTPVPIPVPVPTPLPEPVPVPVPTPEPVPVPVPVPEPVPVPVPVTRPSLWEKVRAWFKRVFTIHW